MHCENNEPQEEPEAPELERMRQLPPYPPDPITGTGLEDSMRKYDRKKHIEVALDVFHAVGWLELVRPLSKDNDMQGHTGIHDEIIFDSKGKSIAQQQALIEESLEDPTKKRPVFHIATKAEDFICCVQVGLILDIDDSGKPSPVDIVRVNALCATCKHWSHREFSTRGCLNVNYEHTGL